MTKPQNKRSLVDAELVTIAEAARRLGPGYSRSNILRRIESGEWEEGIHWIDDRRVDCVRKAARINLTAVNELRAIPAAYR